MKTNMYVFKDTVSGEYSFYGMFVNDAVAVRAFKRACRDPQVFGEDIELYKVGALNTITGKLEFDGAFPYGSDPEFICKGEKYVSD